MAARSGRVLAGEGESEEIGRWRRRLGFAEIVRAQGKEECGVRPVFPSPPRRDSGRRAAPYPKPEKIDAGAVLRGVLDGRVAPNPVFRRLFYGVGPFTGSARHALKGGGDGLLTLW